MVEYKHVKLGNHPIEYLEFGRKNKEVLIFLHGFGLKPKIYEQFLEQMGKKYHVIAPKMYGLNCCSGNKKCSIKNYVELTKEFLTKLRIQKCSIAGHSLGGIIALYIAAQSGKVRRVVGINPVLPTSHHWSWFYPKVHFMNLRELFGAAGGWNSMRFGLKIPIPFAFNIFRNPKSSYRLVKEISNFDYAHLKVKQPTLILFGESDEFFAMGGETTKKIKKSIPKIRIQRLGKVFNHNWLIFYPRTAAFKITGFLNGKTI